MRAWSTRREAGRGPWQRRSGGQAGEAGPQGGIVLCFSHFSSPTSLRIPWEEPYFRQKGGDMRKSSELGEERCRGATREASGQKRCVLRAWPAHLHRGAYLLEDKARTSRLFAHEHRRGENMQEIELSAGILEYEDTEGLGPVVVLLHGLVMDGSLWRHVVRELRTDHRCVVPTMPLGSHRRPMRANADPLATRHRASSG